MAPNTERILQRAARARQDFAEFCRFVLKINPAKHQLEWVQALQDIGDNPAGQRVVIIAPPGSGKTQLVGVGFTAWMIGRYPERHYGLLSYADAVAWSRSFAIRSLIENDPAYRLTFPEVKANPKRWGSSEFQVLRESFSDPHPSLRAGGAMSAVVAYRLNGLVVDDPHDQKNSANSALLDKTWKNYEDAISTRLTADAWEVDIGTRWNSGDFIGHRLAQKGVRVISTAALNRGRSYWEEQYPTDFLQQKQYESPALFALQYMGDTTGGKAQIIRDLKTYDAFSTPPSLMVQMHDLVVASAWDTAMKKREQNDFTVGYTGGLDEYGRIYILDRIKGRYGLPELMNEMQDNHNKWSEFAMWVEDASSGTPAVDTLIAHSMLPVQAITYRGDKHTRAHALAPFLHGGHVLFPKGTDWFADAEHALLNYPNTPHDDDIDALFLLIDNLIKLRHPSSFLTRPRPRVIME